MSDTDSTSGEDEPPTKRSKFEPVRDYYDIQSRMERKSRKFKTQSRVYDVTFQPYNQSFEFTNRLFNDMMDQLYKRCEVRSNDRVRVSILHPDLDFGIHVPFNRASRISGDTLLDEIERVAQSNRQFKIHDGAAQMEITHIAMPQGSGKKTFKAPNLFSMRKSKTSVVCIDNSKDSMCLARSIVVGQCKVDENQTPQWKKRWNLIRQSKKNLQKYEAEALLKQVGISSDQSCGIEEYQKLQDYLYPSYVIKIHPQHYGSELLFKPPALTEKSRVIHIFHHDNHYDCIVSITGFLGRSYYCEWCDVGYDHREGHQCSHICQCYAHTLCPAGQSIRCPDCRRLFQSQACFDNHKTKTGKQRKTICESVWNCKKCGQKVIETKRSHVCPGTKKCRCCKAIVGPDHDCYIPTYEPPDRKQPEVPFIFFDFECRFDSGEHIPNFCVAQRACGDCMCKSVKAPCEYCEEVNEARQMTFRGENTLQQFCTWLFLPTHRGSTVIAHNAQGYDAQFILRYVVTQGTAKPQLIMNGSKIIQLRVHGIRMIDSLSFLSMPLSYFPNTFGLTELAKGWFPFYANTLAYQDYVGPYLPLHFYKPDSMKPERREEFLTWYNERKGDVFDFQKEMEKYCQSDVDILRRGCGEFRQQLLESDQIDPFTEATTLAQVCNKAWRKNSMPPHSLAVISDAGYPNKTRYSMKGIRWLQMMAVTEEIHIRHALNNKGEVKIGPYYVDGYCQETNTVYEFMGCWYHGCPTCFPNRSTINPYTLRSMQQAYHDTYKRLESLKEQGYPVVVMWECEFDQRCQKDPAYKTRVERFYHGQEPIQPREALFGGRTNAIRLYHEVDNDQEIKYVDICSLYPYVNKYRAYPIGHPVIMSQEQIDQQHIEKYKGLIKCRVLPPQDLWMPVLPIHCNSKMVFTLCRTCAEKEMDYCTHSSYERFLYGTWTHVELAKAIALGYQVSKVYHVWHWDEWSTDVYRQYIDKYLKMKQEASGYPPGVDTEEAQDKFKQDYFEAEGIRLQQVEKNPGKRAFAKTMLNCLWGKNAQTNLLPKTEYVHRLDQFYGILNDPKKSVKYAECFDHDEFMLMNYTDESDKADPHSSANPVVASFVTAYARLELYKVLEPLGKRVLYFDTDSCMYIHDPDGYNVPIISSRLGKWTDEVPKGRIVRYVALGPKNYGYEYIENGELHQKCKVKGITLDYNATQQVNFNTMVDCVKDRHHYSTVVEYASRIKRHKDRTVTSEKQVKTFRSVYTKRIVVENHMTVPYGYLHD